MSDSGEGPIWTAQWHSLEMGVISDASPVRADFSVVFMGQH